MSSLIYRYKTSRKTRREPRGALLPALRLAAAGLLAAYLAWLLVFPGMAGSFGRWLERGLKDCLGAASYLLPLCILNAMAYYLRAQRTSGWITLTAGSVIVLLSADTLLAQVSAWLSRTPPLGGAAGAAIYAALSRWIGGFGAFMTAAVGGFAASQVIVGIRWAKLAAGVAAIVAEDYREWVRSRRELEQWKERSAPVGPAASSQVPPSAVTVADDPPAPPDPAGPSKKGPAGHTPGPARADAKPAARPSKASGILPDLSLLNAPVRDRNSGLPTQEELASATARLEQTLRDFGVEAAVTGTSPGPVITRFEVSPAPGVKVSSIVALENDIALAMRARGIRMIAPIPGKAAVGIEIPNSRPVLVTLREILASAALRPDSPPLSFAVGLTADGDPLAADLAAMPHLLVAGATGSGKSVLIHSLILSVLFRAGPDDVKFLLIDPKRLELTFYEGIPHLFDPITPAEDVKVVTDAKSAARSLAAMVKIMEQRYEKFQAHGARHIDGYNQSARKLGLPKEPYIVVVIDELADLMLVARDGVEESIQRLAQMARAVGIHLVLATQRPSVDVITGVIKANLPSRVALQVTSKVDSRVIIDAVGADALQGKGDLLYLAAGAQKPARCQGAFVGEDEIRKVAAFLRSTGKPDYPSLDTIPKPAEADLKNYGVEPGEFRDALKLVLERRRVSQDLLKSQFGSSARATNILSLLEVKGMIHKPEGTNRWDINFDAISAYLSANFKGSPAPSAQAPSDKAGGPS
ncbi:MAG: DNA translocase FtsK 4TM domain-containing protein [Elusimicrobia bacterium]|nr:DNA translocase FtsK 4TM domain-containing protein [Elusimicrobiota bacterium]